MFAAELLETMRVMIIDHEVQAFIVLVSVDEGTI